jgi:hypothetical protein
VRAALYSGLSQVRVPRALGRMVPKIGLATPQTLLPTPRTAESTLVVNPSVNPLFRPPRSVCRVHREPTPACSQVLSADPRCHELLSELLYPHMQRYVSEGDALPPLDLGKCTASHQVKGRVCAWAAQLGVVMRGVPPKASGQMHTIETVHA